jgi:D-alanyl-D-alanine carboxypeptidase (penicillin-binding protein 5/6)
MKKTGEESGVRNRGKAENIRRAVSRTAQTGSTALCVLCLFLLTFHFLLLTPAWAGVDDIKSKAAVVMDATTGRVLYAKNPDLKLLPASTTKLMTALVVVERANLSEVTTASRRAAAQPPSRVGLKPGEKFTLENLLYGALMKSGNDAAVALAEAVGGTEEHFVELMNQKATAIGANNTHFVNANGLPERGQYITAYDLAIIMRNAIKYPILKEILGTRVTDVSTEAGKQIRVRNTNKLLWSDDDVVAGKTGYTRKARHCFVCAGERDNDTIIVALLGEPYRNLLWKESEELMAFGQKVLNKTEDPVIYLTKHDYDRATASTVSYTQDDEPLNGARYTKKVKKRAKHRIRRRRHSRIHTRHRRAKSTELTTKNTDHKKAMRHRAKKGKTKKMIADKENGSQG